MDKMLCQGESENFQTEKNNLLVGQENYCRCAVAPFDFAFVAVMK